jgi:hypothetical protein
VSKNYRILIIMAASAAGCRDATVTIDQPEDPSATGFASGAQPGEEAAGAAAAGVGSGARESVPAEAGVIRVLASSAGLPACDEASAGDAYYTVDDGRVHYCNGLVWGDVTGASGATADGDEAAAGSEDDGRDAGADGSTEPACDACVSGAAAFGIHDGTGRLVGYPVQGSPSLAFLAADEVFVSVDFVTGRVGGATSCLYDTPDCSGACYARADAGLREERGRSTVEGLGGAYFLVPDDAEASVVAIRSVAKTGPSGVACEAKEEEALTLGVQPFVFTGVTLPLPLPVALRFLH